MDGLQRRVLLAIFLNLPFFDPSASPRFPPLHSPESHRGRPFRDEGTLRDPAALSNRRFPDHRCPPRPFLPPRAFEVFFREGILPQRQERYSLLWGNDPSAAPHTASFPNLEYFFPRESFFAGVRWRFSFVNGTFPNMDDQGSLSRMGCDSLPVPLQPISFPCPSKR